ncbi:MAG TPA: exodeoxyribonuclease VII large subunit [Candidatus Saccharimonadales bacterium]|nr:exodeoxyribonuclease VII large subunit [Candidatus Saccharimonadales bacterium]
MDDETQKLRISVSDFIALTNQSLEYAFPYVEVEGEVSSFKVNQGKYVFFDLKDNGGSVGCFMMAWQLRVAIEEGMKVIVGATPKLTQWGKFSLTVRSIRPSGEGSLKKSFELLKEKLTKEGLFAPERKRVLPEVPMHVGIISSIQAAGYGDFIKILGERFGGIKVDVAHVQVQGDGAADQIVRAIKYFNSHDVLPEVLVIVRGGGSADDLGTFNDELLVREIATSRIPTLVGVGHEVDVTLADLAADVRAATPSNAAQLLVPDRREMIRATRHKVQRIVPKVERIIEQQQRDVEQILQRAFERIDRRQAQAHDQLQAIRRVLHQMDPQIVLQRGYAIVRGEVRPGTMLEIEKSDILITAEVRNVRKK